MATVNPGPPAGLDDAPFKDGTRKEDSAEEEGLEDRRYRNRPVAEETEGLPWSGLAAADDDVDRQERGENAGERDSAHSSANHRRRIT